MSERITGLEHLSTGQNCFSWRIQPVVKEGPTAEELKRLERNERQKLYEAQKRALKRDALRVNPENFSCSSFVTNSERAAR